MTSKTTMVTCQIKNVGYFMHQDMKKHLKGLSYDVVAEKIRQRLINKKEEQDPLEFK